MKKLFDLVNSEFTYPDAILTCLENQKKEDIKYVKNNYTDGIAEEKIDQIEIDFDLNMEKFNYITELMCNDEGLQKKFIQTSLYIDYLDLDLGRKLDAILTFGTIISVVPVDFDFLSDDQCYLLSTSMSSLPIDTISSYGMVIASDEILSSVMKKTDDMNLRRKIIFSLYDYLDDCVYDGMSVKELDVIIQKCSELIKNFVC